VIDALLDVPWYAARINGRQEVMIGYSDSAKDVGRVSAGWDLYRAQEDVLAACHRHGIAATRFMAAAGSVGRGGTNTSRVAVAASGIDRTARCV
jgi:phosphoenolpyruvate carboxylase